MNWPDRCCKGLSVGRVIRRTKKTLLLILGNGHGIPEIGLSHDTVDQCGFTGRYPNRLRFGTTMDHVLLFCSLGRNNLRTKEDISGASDGMRIRQYLKLCTCVFICSGRLCSG